MGRIDRYQGIDLITDRKMLWIEFIFVLCLIGISLTAVVLIIMGIARDLSSGNRSIEVRIERGQHTIPAFAFCPGPGANETTQTTLPQVIYCGYQEILSLKSNADATREWGSESNDCPGDMAAQGFNFWRPHPREPYCWILAGDEEGVLVPQNAPATMYIEFGVEIIGMSVWNDTGLLEQEFPSNSSLSNGIRFIFGSVDLITLYESTFQPLNGLKETTYQLVEWGSLSLLNVDPEKSEEDAAVVAANWATDTVRVSKEVNTVSFLTLTAIVLGAVVVVVELVFRNFVLISYQLFFYIPPTRGKEDKDGGGYTSDPYGTLRGGKSAPVDQNPASMPGDGAHDTDEGLKPNPAAGQGWDEGVQEI